jgi:uncharacterized protein (TIGR02466 family)
MSDSRESKPLAQPKRAAGDVELRTYFPTPVALVELADAETLNRELAATILERERSATGTQHSNLGGWQSDWEFSNWGGPGGKHVLDTAVALANRVTANRRGQAVTVNWRINAWANINRQGHANEFHGHPGSFWSGTYYVDDGGIGEDPSLGGEFEMQDPRGLAPAMYAPLLCFAFPGGQSAGASELIRPRAGTLVLFPAWLSHAVRPYRGTRTRISIAFNLGL